MLFSRFGLGLLLLVLGCSLFMGKFMMFVGFGRFIYCMCRCFMVGLLIRMIDSLVWGCICMVFRM